MRALRIAAGAELVTLLVLLTNLATVHWPEVSSVAGPTHGCAYLIVIVLAFQQSRATGTRVASVVPGVGGLLVLRQIAKVRPGAAAQRAQ